MADPTSMPAEVRVVWRYDHIAAVNTGILAAGVRSSKQAFMAALAESGPRLIFMSSATSPRGRHDEKHRVSMTSALRICIAVTGFAAATFATSCWELLTSSLVRARVSARAVPVETDAAFASSLAAEASGEV
jgi:hypothetical protein